MPQLLFIFKFERGFQAIMEIKIPKFAGDLDGIWKIVKSCRQNWIKKSEEIF